jgi:hypothetical protein
MKRKKKMILIIIEIYFAVIFVSGCSSNRISLTDQGLISIDKHDSEKIKILWSEVYQQDGQTWACGVLKPQTLNPVQAHVDIKIFNADGSIQYETRTEDILIAGDCNCKSPKLEKFRVPLPDNLSRDTRISMTLHSGYCKNKTLMMIKKPT